MTHEPLNLTPADDAELTAYALGELDEAAAAVVERRLADDPVAQAHVDDLRALAASLQDDLTLEVSPGLLDAQRETIEARLRGAEAKPVAGRGRFWIACAVSVAAASLLTSLVLEAGSQERDTDGMVGATTATWTGDPVLPARMVGLEEGRAGRVGSVSGGDSARRAGYEVGAGGSAGGGNVRPGFAGGPEQSAPVTAGSANRRAYSGPAGEVPPDSRAPSGPVPPAIQPGRLGDAPVSKPQDRLGRRGVVGGEGQTGTYYRHGGAGGGGGEASSAAAGDKTRERLRRAVNAEAGLGTGGGLEGRFGAGQDGTVALDAEVAQVKALLDQQVRGTQTVGEVTRVLGELAKAENHVGLVAGSDVTLTMRLAEVQVVAGANAGRPVVLLPGGAGRFVQHGDHWVHQPVEDLNGEAYAPIVENPFQGALDAPVSTFSIDVDTASYANVRRMLRNNQIPPADAVRVEELVNYFDYDYEGPSGGDAPFSSHVEVTSCPWNLENRLVRVGLKGREFAHLEPKLSNLVFLVDVSGSMNSPDKLQLLQQSLRLLVKELGENDRVALVAYAGASGLVLDSTSATDQETILAAIDNLRSGGSTNGGAGIELAYKVAKEHFIPNGVNRVVLATDGDFNVGVTDRGDLIRMVEDEAKSNVFLSVLGFGTGNLKDATMEQLADKGNGNYSYIDSLREGRKVLVEERGGTLVTIAKDVKLQIEFNPAEVQSYRLIGYENRMLAREDFNDDTKDAGEIGAGHTVTALYEVVPTNTTTDARPSADPLKYQREFRPTEAAGSGEMLTLKVRYKEPEGTTSRLLEFPVTDTGLRYDQATVDTKFAAAVASFGMLLRGSRHAGTATFDSVLELAMEGVGSDPGGYRAEFLDLVRQAKALR